MKSKLAPMRGQPLAPKTSMRDKVEALKTHMLELQQYQPVTRHHFHGGMYCREAFSEAGVLVVGKVHKKEHFFLVVSGTVSITADDSVITVTGPCLFNSLPGTRRAIYHETEAVCMTFHVTESKTVKEAEEELVEAEFSHFTIGNMLKNEQIEVKP